MIPLVAKARRSGLSTVRKSKLVLDDRRRDLARAMANEAAMLSRMRTCTTPRAASRTGTR